MINQNILGIIDILKNVQDHLWESLVFFLWFFKKTGKENMLYSTIITGLSDDLTVWTFSSDFLNT